MAAALRLMRRAGDADTGANQGVNTPTLTTAALSGGFVQITGSLVSVAGTTYVIDFYSTPAPGNQGRTYLGSTTVAATGAASTFSVSFGAAGMCRLVQRSRHGAAPALRRLVL